MGIIKGLLSLGAIGVGGHYVNKAVEQHDQRKYGSNSQSNNHQTPPSQESYYHDNNHNQQRQYQKSSYPRGGSANGYYRDQQEGQGQGQAQWSSTQAHGHQSWCNGSCGGACSGAGSGRDGGMQSWEGDRGERAALPPPAYEEGRGEMRETRDFKGGNVRDV